MWVPHFQVNKCSLTSLGQDEERHFLLVNLFLYTFGLARIFLISFENILGGERQGQNGIIDPRSLA